MTVFGNDRVGVVDDLAEGVELLRWHVVGRLFDRTVRCVSTRRRLRSSPHTAWCDQCLLHRSALYLLREFTVGFLLMNCVRSLVKYPIHTVRYSIPYLQKGYLQFLCMSLIEQTDPGGEQALSQSIPYCSYGISHARENAESTVRVSTATCYYWL